MGLFKDLNLSRNFRRAALLVCAAAFVSCAPQESKLPETTKLADKPPRPEAKGKSVGIGIEDLFVLQQSDEALIYDVRVAYFYQIDHIPGAINWPHDQFEKQIKVRDIEIQKALESGKKVVLYCFSFTCSEARNVARRLTRRGYDVYVFTKGIDDWRDAGLPLIK